jgi:hypothetical protein
MATNRENRTSLGDFRTFEPWLGSDRQMMTRVAKALDPLRRGSLEVSLS